MNCVKLFPLYPVLIMTCYTSEKTILISSINFTIKYGIVTCIHAWEWGTCVVILKLKLITLVAAGNVFWPQNNTLALLSKAFKYKYVRLSGF